MADDKDNVTPALRTWWLDGGVAEVHGRELQKSQPERNSYTGHVFVSLEQKEFQWCRCHSNITDHPVMFFIFLVVLGADQTNMGKR